MIQQLKIVAPIIGLLVLFFLALRLVGRGRYSKAQKLESEGNFKEACEWYAASILHGSAINKKQVMAKIAALWDKHGPFNYEQDTDNYLSKHGDTPEHCHEAERVALLSIIQESIGSNQRVQGTPASAGAADA